VLDERFKEVILVLLLFSLVVTSVHAQETVDQNITCQEGQSPMSGFWSAILLIFAIIIVAVIVNVVVYMIKKESNRKVKLIDVVYEKDNYPSLAKFQFLLWTFLVAVAFLWIYFIRLWSGVITVPTFDIIPGNILTLMGISVAVPITSGAIGAVKYRSQWEKRNETMERKELVTMLEEGGRPSLTRLQMLLWTGIGLAIYIGTLYVAVRSNLAYPACLALPDIDATIVVLMGLSQGAYVGGKLVATGPGPAITEIKPDKGKEKDEISIFGSGFGEKKDTVWIGNVGIRDDDIKAWTDGRIDLLIPAGITPGPNPVKVAQGGQVSQTVDFTVEKKE
jgi:hypothetical protein